MNPEGHLPPRGLPEHLPDGETVLWQGAPDWQTFACTALHVRAIGFYFFVMLAWRVGADWSDGAPLDAILTAGARFLAFAAFAVSLLYLIAWLAARTTVYTVTNRRIVMRIGIALPITFNIPFSAIESVGIRVDKGGRGDLPLKLADKQRIAYLHLVPHARPWRLSSPEPMLRAIPDVRSVGNTIARVMSQGDGGVAASMTTYQSSAEPARPALLGHPSKEIPA